MESQLESSSQTLQLETPPEVLPAAQQDPVVDSPDQVEPPGSQELPPPLEEEPSQEPPGADDPEDLLRDEPDPVTLDDEPGSQEPEPEPEPEADQVEAAADDWLAEYREAEKLQEMNLDWLPEGTHRDRARKLLQMVDERAEEQERKVFAATNEAEIARAAYETETASMKRMIEQLDGDTTFEQTEEFRTVVSSNQALAQQMTRVAWQAFDRSYPGWEQAPEAQRQAFAEIIVGNEETGVKPSLNNQPGETYLEKMEAAWTYAAFRTGQPVPQRLGLRQTTAQPPQPTGRTRRAPAGQPGEISDAAKAAAVMERTEPATSPLRTVHEKEWDEVLDEHDHLLS